RNLKGTVILAPEGVNGFLAGAPDSLRAALEDLRSLPQLANLKAKESVSAEIPFEHLRVKLKSEIVTFRSGEIKATARHLPAEELHRWLSEGRECVLLDTRNTYESRLGTFHGAHTPAIDHFVDFAATAASFPPEWKKKPVVTFCTGGIRCEKGAPFLASLGFEQVYQLEDGILGYFEKCGGDFFDGECFVFDQRVALGPDLLPTGARLCNACQGPVPAEKSHCIHCGSACS
ncbi:MAG: oxygen-dependent tRNA uridine(34) hydroxylase TrhO, partial [Bdellovibrionota bacterium]